MEGTDFVLYAISSLNLISILEIEKKTIKTISFHCDQIYK